MPIVGPTGTATTWVCARYVFNTTGRIVGLRFYDGFAAESGVLVGVFYDLSATNQWFDAGVYVAQGSMSNGWRNIWLRPWKRIDTSKIYTVAALYRGGGFFRSNNQVASLGTPVFHGNIGLRSSFQSTNLDPANVAISENLNANAVDVLFEPD